MNIKTLSKFRGKFNLLAALTILFVIGLGCSGSVSIGKPEMPTAEQQNALVKQTLSDFAKGVESEDFSAFIQTTAKEFQTQFPADKFKTSFASMIEKKDIVVPILEEAQTKTPQFTNTPAVGEESGNYVTEFTGSFPTDPAKTNFTFKYVWQDSKWKIIRIEVKM